MPKLVKLKVKKRIVQLRKYGRSVPEISQILSMSRSSVYRYAKDVPILPKFKARWLGRRNASKIMSARNWDHAHQAALDQVGSLTSRERKLIACSLYWAEGNKKDLSFTNTDPEMVVVFMDVLRKEFAVKDSDFKISIRIYEDLDREKCINYWSVVTKINLQNNVSINVLGGKKVGRLEFGMCRVRVKKGGLLLKKIFAINKRVVKIISPHSSTDRIRHS